MPNCLYFNPHEIDPFLSLCFCVLRVTFGDVCAFFFLFGGVGAARRLGQCFAKLPFCRFRSSCLVKITGSGGNPYLTTAHPHSFHQVSDGRKTFWIGIGCGSVSQSVYTYNTRFFSQCSGAMQRQQTHCKDNSPFLPSSDFSLQIWITMDYYQA